MDRHKTIIKLQSGYAPGKNTEAKWSAVMRALEKVYEAYYGRDEPFDDALDALMVAYDEWLG